MMKGQPLQNVPESLLTLKVYFNSLHENVGIVKMELLGIVDFQIDSKRARLGSIHLTTFGTKQNKNK